MGSPGGDGGNWPPDGGTPEDLPQLPPEWGDVVIPDDASALAAEAAAVRDELRRERRQQHWRWLQYGPRSGLRAPLLIMAMAVLVTLASLFTAAWPGLTRPANVQRTANSTPSRGLPALDLVAADGGAGALKSLLPAVILLVDGCRCADLVMATAGAVRADITVVTVTTKRPSAAATSAAAPPAAPQPPGPGGNVADSPETATPAVPPAVAVAAVRRLLDPAGELRRAFDLPAPDGTASALLVARDGTIVRTVPRTASVDDFRPDLARL